MAKQQRFRHTTGIHTRTKINRSQYGSSVGSTRFKQGGRVGGRYAYGGEVQSRSNPRQVRPSGHSMGVPGNNNNNVNWQHPADPTPHLYPGLPITGNNNNTLINLIGGNAFIMQSLSSSNTSLNNLQKIGDGAANHFQNRLSNSRLEYMRVVGGKIISHINNINSGNIDKLYNLLYRQFPEILQWIIKYSNHRTNHMGIGLGGVGKVLIAIAAAYAIYRVGRSAGWW